MEKEINTDRYSDKETVRAILWDVLERIPQYRYKDLTDRIRAVLKEEK